MIGAFITEQILEMKWLNNIIGGLLNMLGLDTARRIGGSIQFFLYDVMKITILLCVLIYLISYIQSYFPPEKSKRILGRFHGIGANTVVALFGTTSPSALATTVGVLTEVPVILFLVKIANKTKGKFQGGIKIRIKTGRNLILYVEK